MTEEALALKVAMYGQDGAVAAAGTLCKLYNAVAQSWLNAGALAALTGGRGNAGHAVTPSPLCASAGLAARPVQEPPLTVTAKGIDPQARVGVVSYTCSNACRHQHGNRSVLLGQSAGDEPPAARRPGERRGCVPAAALGNALQPLVLHVPHRQAEPGRALRQRGRRPTCSEPCRVRRSRGVLLRVRCSPVPYRSSGIIKSPGNEGCAHASLRASAVVHSCALHSIRRLLDQLSCRLGCCLIRLGGSLSALAAA